MKTEWFRRKTWSGEDEAAFFDKLKRVRSAGSKAQYLRIQAFHLQEEGLFLPALKLLDTMVSELPEPLQLAQAQMQRGECLAALDRHDEALAAYRHAFAAQRSFPNALTNAYLGFGELVLMLERRDLYDEVLARIEEFGGEEAFPFLRYRLSVIFAFISDDRGDSASARRYARRALDAAAETESPFRYHRKLGLVRKQVPEIRKRLLRLASEVQ
jgi:tetratricopeptide (TPR) repeat protein